MPYIASGNDDSLKPCGQCRNSEHADVARYISNDSEPDSEQKRA